VKERVPMGFHGQADRDQSDVAGPRVYPAGLETRVASLPETHTQMHIGLCWGVVEQ